MQKYYERIKSKDEYKARIEMLNFAQEMAKKKNVILPDEFFIDMKHAIREYAKRPVSEDRVILDQGEYCIVLQMMPESLKTLDEAEWYFVEEMERRYRPSMYDCTGQIFTRWHKIIQRRGRFMVYHALAIDC